MGRCFCFCWKAATTLPCLSSLSQACRLKPSVSEYCFRGVWFMLGGPMRMHHVYFTGQSREAGSPISFNHTVTLIGCHWPYLDCTFTFCTHHLARISESNRPFKRHARGHTREPEMLGSRVYLKCHPRILETVRAILELRIAKWRFT